MKTMLASAAFVLATVSTALAQGGTSAYTTRLPDARAVYLTGAVGDGKADDSAAIQAAIDRAQEDRNEGIVFIPEGRYRLTRTIYVWPAVRVIGWGARRPVLVLGDNTPGFSEGVADMVIFAGARPNATPRPGRPAYRGALPAAGQRAGQRQDRRRQSRHLLFGDEQHRFRDRQRAMRRAVGIRFHGAQHAYLSHMDFHIGSGLAGIHQVANEAEDLRFFGGRYGILAEKPSPAWQFTLIDSAFEGQREAAIREHEVR